MENARIIRYNSHLVRKTLRVKIETHERERERVKGTWSFTLLPVSQYGYVRAIYIDRETDRQRQRLTFVRRIKGTNACQATCPCHRERERERERERNRFKENKNAFVI